MSKKYESVIRKPSWLKINLQSRSNYSMVSKTLHGHGLNTICESGRCPNMSECWSRGTATFMILGDICTCSCRFCATATGRPAAQDMAEPDRVASSVKAMGLKHVVITSVTRDDLPDGGAELWALCVGAIREMNPSTTIELLIPDMNGVKRDLDTIIASGADIIGHNIETIERLTASVRSRAQYRQSLEVIAYLAQKGVVAKSGIMVGLGESADEVKVALKDLRDAGCQIATIGQYLQPTPSHFPVDRYVEPAEFDEYRQWGLEMGFSYVASGPLVRSSYMADEALCGVKRTVSLRDL